MTEADWQQRSYLWAGLGWGQSSNQEVWHQNCTQAPPSLSCKCEKMTHRSTICAAAFFSHPETVPSPPCQALTAWIPVKCLGYWEYFADRLLCNMRSGNRNWRFILKQHRQGGTVSFVINQSFHLALSLMCAHDLNLDMSGRQKRNFAIKSLKQVFHHTVTVPSLCYNFYL